MAVPEEGEVWLCAPALCGLCTTGTDCPNIHGSLTYLWQAHLNNVGWVSFTEEQCTNLESSYSKPGSVIYSFMVDTTYDDGVSCQVELKVDFEKMLGQMEHTSDRWSEQSFVQLRRVSTPSYASPSARSPSKDSTSEPDILPSACPWRWYYDDGTAWKLFEEDGLSPMQCVLEAKYLAGQKIYRYEATVPLPPTAPFSAMPTNVTVLVDFPKMCIFNLTSRQRAAIRRRPLFLSLKDCLLRKFADVPSSKPVLYKSEVPETWYPLEQASDFELVPLDPDSMEHHLVASEFVKTGMPNWKILDIFRTQNPFLWHKFNSKKQFMELKSKNANEMLLFHGTSSETSVQSILQQNFDWRLSGKNATVFGEGSYFARDASLSDKYTGGATVAKTRWMFMARVLVGQYIRGSKMYKRPPPIDDKIPHGDLYDSCVNDVKYPSIFVVFENDQCYPEYLISYAR